MSDGASFRNGCFWSHTWIYYKVINYWSQRKRQLWGDFWLWHGADVLGIHIDLVVLVSWMCLEKHCSVGAEPPKSNNPEDPSSFAIGNCLLSFSRRRKNMHSYKKKLLGLIGRSLEWIKRDIGAMSEAPAIKGQ